MKKYLPLLLMLLSVNLLTAQESVTLIEDFNNGFPTDWSNQTQATDGGWIVGNAASIRSAYWPIQDPEDGSTFIATNDDACNCDKNEDRLVFPALDLTNETALVLSFDMIFGGLSISGVIETLTLQVSTDSGATWTDLTEIAGDNTIDWRNFQADVSDYTGQDGVHFGLLFSDGGGWLYGAAIDNVTLIKPYQNDISLQYNPNSYRFADISNGYDVSGIITNVGAEMLESVDITITEGMNTYTETISGLALNIFESSEFTVNIPIASPSSFSVEVTASNPNAQVDQDDSNNGASFEGVGVENAPSKKIFVEEATGTWCPWCPRGAVFMDLMEEQIGDSFVGVAVHVGQPTWPDPMEIQPYASDFAQGVAFPTLVLDRGVNPGIPGLADMPAFGQALVDFTRARPSPIGLSVDATLNEWTREMTINVEATAHSNMDNVNYSIVMLVTEDHIMGDAFDYRQANNYAGGQVGPMNGWELLGNPASGNDIEYNHTLRAAIGGFSGVEGIIPSTIQSGDTYSTTQTYAVPEEFDMEELNIAIAVLDLDNGEVYNANIDKKIDFELTSVDEITQLAHFSAYPNPAVDNLRVEVGFNEVLNYNIIITDVNGKTVRSLGNFRGDSYNETLDITDLTSGVYNLNVLSQEGTNVIKFVKL